MKASGKKEGEGRGGMASKLKIAKGTAKKDIPTYIANGKRENVIVDIVDDLSLKHLKHRQQDT